MAIFSLCQAQNAEPSGELLFEDTISFDPLNEWITIPSPDANIWQIGYAQKSFLDYSLSSNAVMITDTINSYPTLVDNYFLLSIPSTDNFFTWPEGILSFYHKFQTDSLLDGGFIEISEEKVLLLLETVERASEIDKARAEAASTRAKEKLESRPQGINFERARFALLRSLNRLSILKK